MQITDLQSAHTIAARSTERLTRQLRGALAARATLPSQRDVARWLVGQLRLARAAEVSARRAIIDRLATELG
jgi:hypothetical protein